MDKFEINKRLIVSLLKRMAQSINEDPERSIRKIADMGKRVAPGSFQKKVFTAIQSYLEDPDCGYYSLFRQTAADVAPENLAGFFTNLLYCSLSYGTEINRSIERESRLFLPWSLVFKISGEAGDLALADRLVGEGQKLGIYCHGIFTDNCGLAAFEPLAAKYGDCALLFFIKPTEAATAAQLSKKYTNVAFLLDSATVDAAAFGELKNAGALYGAYRVFDRASVSDSAVNAFIDSVLPFSPVTAMSVAGADCREPERIVLSRFSAHCRTERRLPILPSDLYSDMLFIDSVISDGPMYFGLLPGGRITSYNSERGEFETGRLAGDRPLRALLVDQYAESDAKSNQ